MTRLACREECITVCMEPSSAVSMVTFGCGTTARAVVGAEHLTEGIFGHEDFPDSGIFVVEFTSFRLWLFGNWSFCFWLRHHPSSMVANVTTLTFAQGVLFARIEPTPFHLVDERVDPLSPIGGATEGEGSQAALAALPAFNLTEGDDAAGSQGFAVLNTATIHGQGIGGGRSDFFTFCCQGADNASVGTQGNFNVDAFSAIGQFDDHGMFLVCVCVQPSGCPNGKSIRGCRGSGNSNSEESSYPPPL